MATYSTNIVLKEAFQSDYHLLEKELQRSSFQLSSLITRDQSAFFTDGIAMFTGQGRHITEVVDKVQRAARKTGRLFSFTVIKNKISS